MHPRIHAAFLSIVFLLYSFTVSSQPGPGGNSGPGKNTKPKIVGQTPSPLTTTANTPITIQLSNLIVQDDDSPYPQGFSLEVKPGKNYSVKGNIVTPNKNFAGRLSVLVQVNDGKDKSDDFGVQIDVGGAQNIAPTITGQSPLSIDQGSNITVTLSNLNVNDPDNSYPSGFALHLFSGNNYTLNGNTVTPSPAFTGNLTVPVSVNDGQSESNRFNLQITVAKAQNKEPKITGQSPLTMNQGASLTIELTNLQVTDPDNIYPTDFTLKVYDGINYSVNGNTITPSSNFKGQLKVPITVNDGQIDSKRFDLKVDVAEVKNIAPQITGQSPLTVIQGSGIAITLTNLQVTDPDNIFPGDFTLKLFNGPNYTVNGNTVTPNASFSGNLKVPVTVNDGKNESNHFDLQITVTKPQNVAPIITGQERLTTKEDEGITIQLSNLKITDPDKPAPSEFKLTLGAGSNYSASSLTITPAKDFFGILSVPTIVNDGQNDSEPFNLQVTVSPVNDAPVITGQIALATNENTLITIDFAQLLVTDPDNAYPHDFTLKVFNGNNYSAAGKLINPAPGFTGVLDVGVRVNDGISNSNEFKLKINVVPVITNVAPVITGQKPISITQNTTLTLQFSQLTITDPDDVYPQGFTLKVLAGTNYTVNGTTITPAPNFANGNLSVRVMVNDGEADSQPFQVVVHVLPPSAKPRINGQRELMTPEDSAITITLADLFVTDADDPEYPSGFTLKVMPGKGDLYTINGNSVVPPLNFAGFVEVGVAVSDGVNTSDVFQLSILVTPVDDAPELIETEASTAHYEPGEGPIALCEFLNVQDVDNDYLIMAEVGFRPLNHSPANDELIFNYDNPKLRAVVDSDGTMYLIGYASVTEYQDALRSIQYNYKLTRDINGNPQQILTGPRTVYYTVYDGEMTSEPHEKQVSMDVKIALDIPSAFTPNGDHTNDTWQVHATNTDQADHAIVRVYDKRGALLYESKGFEKAWDGINNGQVLPVDTYYYTIDMNLPYMRQSFKGAVTLLH